MTRPVDRHGTNHNSWKNSLVRPGRTYCAYHHIDTLTQVTSQRAFSPMMLSVSDDVLCGMTRLLYLLPSAMKP